MIGEKAMLEVKDTKVPTLKQVRNIVSNLREMFPDNYSALTFETHSYTHNPISDPVEHSFYLHANGECWSIHSWEELLESYHCLVGDPDA